MAKGAVPLYDKLLTDGKIITYGITFDVGKSTIKPESMGTINEVFGILQQHPELKFSVEGHTDNTGNATLNQSLSESRAQAVCDKLQQMAWTRSTHCQRSWNEQASRLECDP
jgi:outer membrane protein OmpA-like peptidoglycan-associated protein